MSIVTKKELAAITKQPSKSLAVYIGRGKVVPILSGEKFGMYDTEDPINAAFIKMRLDKIDGLYVPGYKSKEHRTQLMRDNRKSDPLLRFKDRARNNINFALKNPNNKKPKKAESFLSCSASFFKSHISSQFLEGMSFSNYGEWQIDHKIPLAVAKTENDVLLLCHYTNLRPLWAKDNLIKGKKMCA
jgi:hypothetical protein